jgi:methylamine dehydrogenase heavy chain
MPSRSPPGAAVQIPLAAPQRIAYDPARPPREMRMRTLPSCAVLMTMLAQGTVWAAPPPPLAAEQLTIEALPPPGPHWVYVIDEAFSNEIDARVRLFDGDSYRHLGQIDAGFTPGVILSPDGRTTAVATTYFARGAHGQRTDVVEFTDNATLAISGEIVLPPKRTQGPQSYFNLGYSADSHFLYVSYVTPAASFGVLDPAAHTVLSEVDTAGCVLVIPSGPNRVSSLCDNGRLLTVTLDAGGHEAARSLSEVWFDPDSDPVFVQGIPSGKGYTFLSFLGQVHEIDLSGAQPVIAAPWSLLGPGEKDHWRPGGQQMGAIQIALGRLYVPMHVGGEGTHKAGGTEIWVYDIRTHHRTARWPLAPLHLAPVLAVQVTQDSAPVLFAATEQGEVAVLDALTGRLRHVEKHLGDTPWFFMNP